MWSFVAILLCYMWLPSVKDKDSSPISKRSEEHTSELQSQSNLVCRLLLEKKKKQHSNFYMKTKTKQRLTARNNFSTDRSMIQRINDIAISKSLTTIRTISLNWSTLKTSSY